MYRYITNEYDNRFMGKRGFIIGGGPSIINNMEGGFNFTSLRDEITIGVNKAYKLMTPRYLVFGDFYFWQTFKEEIRQQKCVRMCPDDFSRRTGGVDHDVFLIRRNMQNGLDKLVSETFSKEVSAWNNTGVFALRIAYILGLNPIYLMGIDVVREDSKGNTHFHKDYDTDRVKAVNDKRYSNFLIAWQRTIQLLKKRDIQIYSCSKISRLNDIIPYVDVGDIGLK